MEAHPQPSLHARKEAGAAMVQRPGDPLSKSFGSSGGRVVEVALPLTSSPMRRRPAPVSARASAPHAMAPGSSQHAAPAASHVDPPGRIVFRSSGFGSSLLERCTSSSSASALASSLDHDHGSCSEAFIETESNLRDGFDLVPAGSLRLTDSCASSSQRQRPVHAQRGLAHLAGAFSAVNSIQIRASTGGRHAVFEFEPQREPSLLQRSHPRAQQQGQEPSGKSHWRLPVLSLRLQRRRAQEDSRREKAGGKAAAKTGGVMDQLLCGAFAGVVSRTAVAPIDLVRAHLISSHGMEGVKKTAMGVLTTILKRDGWKGLFRGNGINCLRVAPNKAIELCTFEMLKRTLCAPGHPLQHIAAPLSGGAAGMAGTIVTYPLEVMRTRISLQPELYANLGSTFTRMVKEEGLGSLYRGLPISLVGVFPYAATNYFVYDAARGLYRRATGRDKVPTEVTLVFGALAASVSSAVTFPLEVARRHLQLGVGRGMAAPSLGLQVLRQICEKEGWQAVYRGLGTTWLKLIPAAGISFVCYEAARYALRVDDASYAAAAAAKAAAAAGDSSASAAAHSGGRTSTALASSSTVQRDSPLQEQQQQLETSRATSAPPAAASSRHKLPATPSRTGSGGRARELGDGEEAAYPSLSPALTPRRPLVVLQEGLVQAEDLNLLSPEPTA